MGQSSVRDRRSRARGPHPSQVREFLDAGQEPEVIRRLIRSSSFSNCTNHGMFGRGEGGERGEREEREQREDDREACNLHQQGSSAATSRAQTM